MTLESRQNYANEVRGLIAGLISNVNQDNFENYFEMVFSALKEVITTFVII